MDTGSNKSLLTLIAVVTFGIFLSLSYWLFQEELKNVLASVFTSTNHIVDTKIDYSLQLQTDAIHFQITDNGNGTCTIIGYDVIGGLNVVIPEKINNLIVTTIGPKAFLNTGLKSVVIPLTVTKIDNNESGITEGAFRGCDLTTVILPDSITYVGRDSFYNSKIKNLVLSKNLEFIGIGAFNVNLFKEITIPNSVKTIKYNAFGNNPYLESIKIPKSVTNIPDSIFFSNSGMQSIYIPSELKSIFYENSRTLQYNSTTYYSMSKVHYY